MSRPRMSTDSRSATRASIFSMFFMAFPLLGSGAPSGAWFSRASGGGWRAAVILRLDCASGKWCEGNASLTGWAAAAFGISALFSSPDAPEAFDFCAPAAMPRARPEKPACCGRPRKKGKNRNCPWDPKIAGSEGMFPWLSDPAFLRCPWAQGHSLHPWRFFWPRCCQY